MTIRTRLGHLARIGRRTAVRLPALAGVGYTVAWVASLSVGAPNPSVAATGRQVVAAYASQRWQAMAMFVLAEGIAAVALAIVVIHTANAASASRARRAGLAGAGFGIAAVVVSLAELAVGTWLVCGPVPGRQIGGAAAAYQALMRLDGAKMLLLAAMAAAFSAVALTTPVLPRWLALPGLLLAAALVVSGLGYLLIAPDLATAVWVAGVLLLAFVTGTGVTARWIRQELAR